MKDISVLVDFLAGGMMGYSSNFLIFSYFVGNPQDYAQLSFVIFVHIFTRILLFSFLRGTVDKVVALSFEVTSSIPWVFQYQKIHTKHFSTPTWQAELKGYQTSPKSHH